MRHFSTAFLGVFWLVLSACGEQPSPSSAVGSGGMVVVGAAGAVAAGGMSGAPGGGQANTAGGGVGSGGGAGSATGGAAGSGGGGQGKPTVVLFLIDGLQADAVATGVANGAENIKFLIDNGVTAETVYATSPAPRLELPDASLPWGNATSGNVGIHTGCHLFESSQMDDIFLAARAGGLTSVFSGGDANYAAFTTPDFEYAANISDADVVQHGIEHLKDDGARLIRLHLQRIRDSWSGPAGKTSPASPYIQHLLAADALLGTLIQALKDAAVWDNTYVILTSDHGMGQAAGSDHPPSTRSSWSNVMVFYGPTVKKGETIPYAETPDVAVMTNHLLGLAPLQGHTDPDVTLAQKGATATLLLNIFEGAPRELPHPRYVEKYLDLGTFASGGNNYADYRTGMLGLIK